MQLQRRHARRNPGASAGGIILTLAGFGLMAFSGFELFAAKRTARPAPPKIKTKVKPARPAAPATLPGAAPSGGVQPQTPSQVQQAIQAGQAITQGAEALFGGGTPGASPEFNAAQANFDQKQSDFDQASAAFDAGVPTPDPSS